ncbi:hypothetical protein TNCV_4063571 [Trichonephila clavipes]|nr:hypothetical protein TNCV_4063571 [Trichonephila clavipes]
MYAECKSTETWTQSTRVPKYGHRSIPGLTEVSQYSSKKTQYRSIIGLTKVSQYSNIDTYHKYIQTWTQKHPKSHSILVYSNIVTEHRSIVGLIVS